MKASGSPSPSTCPPMPEDQTKKLANLSFDDFRRLATNPSLSQNEKIGFLDRYREGAAAAIFSSLLSCLPTLRANGRLVMDIGPGCSELPRMLAAHCAEQSHQLILVDNPEMLEQLPDAPFIRKVAAEYPSLSNETLAELEGRVDVITCYSVFHYIFPVCPLHRFVDTSLRLLAPDGVMLVGDIPNFDKKNRFFSTSAGRAFHRENSGDGTLPNLDRGLHVNWIDDAAVFDLMHRVRASGSESYLLPQDPSLPFANRREDLLIVRR